MENTDTFSDNHAPINESPGHPRSWQCTKLTDVRRRMIDVIKQIEKDGATKCTRERVNYYRLLVYAYQTLASVVKDGELDDMEARLSLLEGKNKTGEI